MAGDYYNSAVENPANRAANQPGILDGIFSALVNLGRDIFNPKKFQDRGSANPVTTDILRLNSPSTPPASVQFNVPENPELRNSHQYNEKQFRFLGINTGQGGNKQVSGFGPALSPNHTPMFVNRIPSLSEVLGKTPRSNIRIAGEFGGTTNAKKIIDAANVNAEPSGASGGASAPSAPSAPSHSSGGFSGGGRITR